MAEVKKGFTLVELVMVIIVTAIMAVVIMVAINNALRAIQFNAATEKLVSDLRYAQAMASGNGKWYGVAFEADPTNRYSIYLLNGTSESLAENPAHLGQTLVVNLGEQFGTLISDISIEGGGTVVEINPLGVPYTDKFGYIISQESYVTISKDGQTRRIFFTPESGRIYSQ
ncbi:hypothetical protein A2311_01880 [candidate division WOR-1 bacterium RIFOXYB2_FULL_48_7]|uniref:General secretion pathway GspH domain-containing protein n=1 Tax=candidate division WOR-1 bacterium RIFOXYB2_FULL_48_7 TaxID=1802583 RepID=A0A1F4TN33_UNCSA|nr:MAG: hypothetical protein A2311_01880 [candidate division WOR-1 bacterium RIFOXYB2_FULL_48_7]